MTTTGTQAPRLQLSQVVTLISESDITPSFALVVQRGREGHPVKDFHPAQLRARLSELRAYLDAAEAALDFRDPAPTPRGNIIAIRPQRSLATLHDLRGYLPD